jgi:NDP-sugar pyrophosphorylase family protein
MKALVLAAGLGERLRPLTDTVPKPLLELGGRRLIEYSLAMLRRAGIAQVMVNVYHLADQIRAALGDGRAYGLEISYAPEEVLLGTGGPLSRLRGYFGNESFVVANSDNILDLDLASMIEFHRRRRAVGTFALYRPQNQSAYSQLEIDRDGRLRRIRFLRRDTGGFDDVPSGLSATGLQPYMFCGVYVCEPQALAGPLPEPPFGSIQELFAPMLARNVPLYGYVHRSFFRTVDDLATYQALREEFALHPPAI